MTKPKPAPVAVTFCGPTRAYVPAIAELGDPELDAYVDPGATRLVPAELAERLCGGELWRSGSAPKPTGDTKPSGSKPRPARSSKSSKPKPAPAD